MDLIGEEMRYYKYNLEGFSKPLRHHEPDTFIIERPMNLNPVR